eukprot:1156665-Pelagomonas_calceolata.AAC.8
MLKAAVHLTVLLSKLHLGAVGPKSKWFVHPRGPCRKTYFKAILIPSFLTAYRYRNDQMAEREWPTQKKHWEGNEQ